MIGQGIKIVCPFCFGEAHAQIVDRPEENAYVVHSSPPCAAFIELDAEEYLAAARAAIVQLVRKGMN